MNTHRRAIDRGHDRDPEVEAHGFMSRLYFSVPGQEVQMRENTTQLPLDAVRQITVHDVLTLLDAKSIMTFDGVTCRKYMEDLGMSDLSPEDSVRRLVAECDRNREEGFDLHQPGHMERFLEIELRQQAHRSKTEYGCPNCVEFVAEAVPQLARFIRGQTSPEMRLADKGRINEAFASGLERRLYDFLLSKDLPEDVANQLANNWNYSVMHALLSKGWQRD